MGTVRSRSSYEGVMHSSSRPISFELGRGRAPHAPAVGFSAWRGDAQFSAVVQVHDGSELVQLSKDPLTQRSPEQHELVTEQCWPAPGQLPA